MARINIPFIVDKQNIIQRPRVKVVAGSKNHIYAVFDLCGTWSDIEHKRATFTRDNKPWVMDLTHGDNDCLECKVPWEVMTEEGYFDVGIFGGDRLPTTTARVFVEDGCVSEGNESQPPTPDWFDKIESQIEELSGGLKEEDKTEIVNMVIATLPTWTGGEY